MPEAPGTLVNGLPGDTVPVSDRGLQYGDGLFETIAVVDGRPQHWQRHLRRLAAGCRRLGLAAPDEALLGAEAARLGAAGRCVLKLILTRGSGGRGYRPPLDPQPTRIVSTHPWPEYPPDRHRTGVTVRRCRTRLARNPALAGIKHLNRLEQVLARSEWDDPLIAEGLTFDTGGSLIEGTMSNVFLATGGLVRTPALDQAGVAGVMREVVIDACREQGIPVQVCELDETALLEADEVFLTGSVIGIWPVCALAGAPAREWSVGAITRSLIRYLCAAGSIPGDTDP